MKAICAMALAVLLFAGHAWAATGNPRNPFCDEGSVVDSGDGGGDESSGSGSEPHGGGCQVDVRVLLEVDATGVPTRFRETQLDGARLEPTDDGNQARIWLDINALVIEPGQSLSIAEFTLVPTDVIRGESGRLVLSLAEHEGRVELVADLYEVPVGGWTFFCNARDEETPRRLIRTGALVLGDDTDNFNASLGIWLERNSKTGLRYVSITPPGTGLEPVRIAIDDDRHRDWRLGQLRNAIVAWKPAPVGTGAHLLWLGGGENGAFRNVGRIGACDIASAGIVDR